MHPGPRGAQRLVRNPESNPEPAEKHDARRLAQEQADDHAEGDAIREGVTDPGQRDPGIREGEERQFTSE